jgi:uroporphyrinogen decarboxylase
VPTQLTSRQRVERMLLRRDHDRIPRFDNYWQETIANWRQQGLSGGYAEALAALGSDFQPLPLNIRSTPAIPEVLLHEDDQTRTTRNGWGATLRQWKNRSGVPEHVAFDCDSRAKWEATYRPALLASLPEIKEQPLRESFAAGRREDKWVVLYGNEPFEAMRKLMGDEVMLLSMIDDPQWIRDFSSLYTDLMIRNLDMVLAMGLRPDSLWVWGDMAYSRGTFCSPAMYRELIWPDHRRLADAAHARGMKLIYHTDGDVRAVVGMLIEAGFDCLQPMEAKAGMDIRELAPRHGDKLSFMGNIDARVLASNDPQQVEHELRTKLAAAMPKRGYCYHSDHSVPHNVLWSTYRYTIDLLDELGRYE